jgi:hypothetical protein
MPFLKQGTKVYNASGTKSGEATGVNKRCSMDGCTGVRVGVRWNDKKLSWPCSKGLVERPDGASQIG